MNIVGALRSDSDFEYILKMFYVWTFHLVLAILVMRFYVVRKAEVWVPYFP